ncbi:hypothetical protein N665_0092s0007 [Sinapis alba]|nr:hypothetical protein N665_0092s0007 [Sinapis alba]
MNTSFWNCRGLKGSMVVRRLKGIKRSYSPDILFLVETKNSDDKIRDVGVELGYDYVKCVTPDLLFQGNNMTWSNKRKDNLIQCWLDRALVNDEWCANYSASKVLYLEMIESDHRPAVIQIRKNNDCNTPGPS